VPTRVVADLALGQPHRLFSAVQLASLAVEHGVPLAEGGSDAIILWDNLTRLESAQDLQSPAGGRTLTGRVGARALNDARNLFGTGRACRGGGSVTIFATCLADTGSRGDDLLPQQLKATMCICRATLQAQASTQLLISVHPVPASTPSCSTCQITDWPRRCGGSWRRRIRRR
jgi:hypothetical protein